MKGPMLIKIYFSGLIILFGAMAINATAKFFRLPTWYDFLAEPKINIISFTWLFIVYPLLLGVLVFLFRKYIAY